jgi:putative transposase
VDGKKRIEKLKCMHRNPVARGLMENPEDWIWSSYRFDLLDEEGPVRINEEWTEIRLTVR